MPAVNFGALNNLNFYSTNIDEQKRIGDFFTNLDNLITLHQCKCDNTKIIIYIAWEQRKLEDILTRRVEQRKQSEEYPRLAFASGQGVIPLSERKTNNREQLTKDEFTKMYLVTELDDIVYNPANVKYGAIDRNKCGRGLISPIYVTFTTSEIPGFIECIVTSHDFQQRALRFEEGTVTKRQSVNPEDFVTIDILVAPQKEEQRKISEYFDCLDHLITLHQQKYIFAKYVSKYAKNDILEAESASVGGSRTSFWKKEIFNMGMMTVYHGGYKAVEQPEIRKGRNTKDFGTGFYCTIIKEQAQRWARRYDTKVVSIYDVRMEADLNIKEFKEMTEEWLDFIVACRSGLSHDYDIVIGAMADDQIYNYVSDYMDGVITREQFWVLAKFKYPTHQIAFCTERSLKCLEYRDCEVL